jgi:voltage-gated potassium channel
MPAPATAMGRLRVGLRRLFYGHRPAAVRFQIGLLALDLAGRRATAPFARVTGPSL